MFVHVENIEKKTIFVLETHPDGALPELCSAVYEACREQNWLDRESNHECRYFRDWQYLEFAMKKLPPEKIIPVGSVEFVNAWADKAKLQHIHALNIPSELLADRRFLMREIFRVQKLHDLDEISKQYGTLLVKPDRNPKRFEATPYTIDRIYNISGIPDDEPLFATQMLELPIVAEWRVFCQLGRIINIRPYILDEWLFPDGQKAKAMVDALKDYPAITLDVAVLEDGSTVALEVHNFIACGLYGFGGPAMLRMTKAAWKYELELQKREKTE